MNKVVICPTITAFDAGEYKAQVERVQGFAKRIHIDLMDGEFAPTKSPGLDEIWWPPELVADIHLMYQRPMDQLQTLIRLKPSLVIIHQEADVDHRAFAQQLKAADIKAGLGLLSGTSVEQVADNLTYYDHALIFSGDLGRHGGIADLVLLSKVKQLRAIKPELEISWDGGIDAENARILIEGGVDVLNAGSFVQQSKTPEHSYNILQEI